MDDWVERPVHVRPAHTSSNMMGCPWHMALCLAGFGPLQFHRENTKFIGSRLPSVIHPTIGTCGQKLNGKNQPNNATQLDVDEFHDLYQP